MMRGAVCVYFEESDIGTSGIPTAR